MPAYLCLSSVMGNEQVINFHAAVITLNFSVFKFKYDTFHFLLSIK